MSKGNTTENDLLKMVLQGTDPAWRVDANVYISLHTADPGEAGSQTTSEATYGAYARVAVVKASGWTDGGATFTNSGLIQFPQCTSGTNTITHAAIGTVTSGAGQILWSGALAASLAVSAGIQPQFSAGVISVSED